MSSKIYLAAFFVVLLGAAGVYFVYNNQPNPQTNTKLDMPPDQETTIVTKTQIEPEEKAQQLEKVAELQEKITDC